MCKQDVKMKGIYKHFKGDYYLLEDVAIIAKPVKSM